VIAFSPSACFRCHDGNHVSPEGKVIRKDCNICHTILRQQENAINIASVPGLEFKHLVVRRGRYLGTPIK